jgi:UDP-N-acetylglucosamine:LPS N-acetylglucosamine transferase
MKIALACSAGGHLTEMQQLEKAYKNHSHFFVTFRREDSRELERAHFVADPRRNPLKILKNIAQSLAVFLKERPDIVITTGAGVAVPFCFIAKIFGKRIIYIESFCRVSEPSLTGKLLYPIADLFLVQWEELLAKYGKKAKFLGRLL